MQAPILFLGRYLQRGRGTGEGKTKETNDILSVQKTYRWELYNKWSVMCPADSGRPNKWLCGYGRHYTEYKGTQRIRGYEDVGGGHEVLCDDVRKAWRYGQGGVVTWGRHGGVVKEVW